MELRHRGNYNIFLKNKIKSKITLYLKETKSKKTINNIEKHINLLIKLKKKNLIKKIKLK